jgi:hypothetical protein
MKRPPHRLRRRTNRARRCPRERYGRRERLFGAKRPKICPHGVLKYQKSVRANFDRNTCTTDVSDAAPNRCPRALTLRPILPRLCSANTFIARHNQHILNIIQNAVVVGGGRSNGVATEARRPLLSDGFGKHASASPPSRYPHPHARN